MEKKYLTTKRFIEKVKCLGLICFKKQGLITIRSPYITSSNGSLITVSEKEYAQMESFYGNLEKIPEEKMYELLELCFHYMTTPIDQREIDVERTVLYQPVWCNGENYEDFYTEIKDIVFKNKKDCIDWIESQTACSKNFVKEPSKEEWKLPLSKKERQTDYSGDCPYQTYEIKEIRFAE